jgi:hypothetical protein
MTGDDAGMFLLTSLKLFIGHIRKFNGTLLSWPERKKRSKNYVGVDI